MIPPEEERRKTPILSFDEIMYRKLETKFMHVLNKHINNSYNAFETFIRDLQPKYYSNERCFEIYDMIRKSSYITSASFMDELRKKVVFKESFIRYMNAKKSKIIDDLIKRYE